MDAIKTMEDLRAWKCPDCGAPGAVFKRDLEETYTCGTTPEGSRLMAYGVDPGPLLRKTVPVSYAQTITCDNGHDHFVGLEYVKQT